MPTATSSAGREQWRRREALEVLVASQLSGGCQPARVQSLRLRPDWSFTSPPSQLPPNFSASFCTVVILRAVAAIPMAFSSIFPVILESLIFLRHSQ